ncbi:hypothetical protein CO683_00830 [Bradyrhizobium ottawaense]|uniref:hypothetical protein n=1 Tax=Bradyrhizobium ottawaense TaxID=931866 RepID=UPI000BE84C57|nr:hypothetical protein [Bradyrhizobium ottawaense]PDT71736.1 hypothetical protein CO683_00830 [Bradyrhizobium ottawaense]
MATETELVNAALRKGGGAKRILDMTDSVGSAGIAADVLAFERDELLRSGVWNFAVTRIQLGQMAAEPVFGWTYAYALPSDCERVVSVHDNADGTGAVPYKIESVLQVDGSYVNAIVTDASAIYLRYCRQITDPNLMTASFRQMLILRMAKIFAISIAKSNPLFQALDAELKDVKASGRSVDGQEDYPEQRPEGSWASSRRATGWSRDNSGWPQR